jgi:nucleoside-diphosphate-sugar epimerase
MKIFVAGATGALGRRLVPLLVANGHTVVGTTRTPGKAEALRAAGATPVVLDALDRDAVIDAVGRAEPEVVVHELTALAGLRRPVEAVRYLERVVLEAEGVQRTVLRYGGFYGPGTSLGEGGVYLEAVRRRQFPIVAAGTGVWSFVHIDDAATATLAAIERGRTGVYNIVDDDPAPVAEWLPALAAAIGAKPPRRVPAWLARPLVGAHGVVMMTESRGASNAMAKRELGWRPAYPSWRTGFRVGLGSPGAIRAA